MYFLLVPVFQTFLLQKEIFWSVLRFANSFVSLNKSGQFSIIPKPKLRNFFDHLKVTGNRRERKVVIICQQDAQGPGPIVDMGPL